MASRSLFVTLTKQSALFRTYANRGLHSMSGLSSTKSSKEGLRPNPINGWTEKQHEEWVDRIFGPLKKPQHKKTDNKTKEDDKNSQ